jgi:hypothetical protein
MRGELESDSAVRSAIERSNKSPDQKEMAAIQRLKSNLRLIQKRDRARRFLRENPSKA